MASYPSSERVRYISIPDVDEKTGESNFDYEYGGFTVDFFNDQKKLMDDIGSKTDEAEEKSETDRKKQTDLRGRIDALRKYLDLKVQKDNYENLKTAREKAEDDLRISKSIFEGEIPDAETAKKWADDAILLREDEKELRAHELTRAEAERLEEETKKFSKSIPSSAEIDKLLEQWNKISDIKDDLPDRREHAEAIKNSALEAQRETYKPFVALLAAGLAVIIISVLLAIFVHPLLGLIAILGAGAIVFGFILKKKHDDETRATGEGTAKRYNELMSKIAEDEEFVEGTEMDAQDLLGNVGITFVGRSATSDLLNLRNQVREYEALKAKKKRHEDMIK